MLGMLHFEECRHQVAILENFLEHLGKYSQLFRAMFFKRVTKYPIKYFWENSAPCRLMYESILGKARRQLEESVLTHLIPLPSYLISTFSFFCFRIAKYILSGKKKKKKTKKTEP